jgi:hypothetical protein
LIPRRYLLSATPQSGLGARGGLSAAGVRVVRGRGLWGASAAGSPRRLTPAGTPLLGVIANGFKATRGSYGYSYDYSYTPDKQSSPTPAADVTSPNGAASAEETVPTIKG